MMDRRNARIYIAAAALAVTLGAAMPMASAQTPTPPPAPGTSAPPDTRPGPGGAGRGYGPGWGPGMMMGPNMMLGSGMRGGFGGMCDPRAAGLAEWRADQIERAVKLTEAQRSALDDLRAASAKAIEAMAAACPTEFPLSSSARMEFMEKRMAAMLQAIKTVRPAFDALYASLSDEQKARLDATGPRRWRWQRWRDR